jgi:hypothetical protein
LADYFVASGGSNTAPYDTWAKAATSLQTALTAASASGDIIAIQYNGVPAGDAEVAGATTYTFNNNVSLIASTNSGTSTITPTAMSTANWIGNSTTNRNITLLAVGFRIYTYGLTFRTAGATAASLIMATGDGSHWVHDTPYFWSGNTNSGAVTAFSSQDHQMFVRCVNPTFRFGAVGQFLRISAKAEFTGGEVSSAGSTPTALLTFTSTDPGGCTLVWEGADLSVLGSNSILGDNTTSAPIVWLTRCKLGTGFSLLATQTNLNRSSGEVFAFDCSNGDTHGLFAYANAMGSVSSDTGIYFTAGAAAQSWKIVTTAACSYHTPFETPWFSAYNSTLSSQTPYVEILRDGSTTAFQNDEVWGEFSAKVTSGSTQASFSNDKMALAGAPANQAAGAGLGSWTGESGTAWSGKVDSGSAITPAELGHIRARIVVGEPSITVYLDPQIRT